MMMRKGPAAMPLTVADSTRILDGVLREHGQQDPGDQSDAQQEIEEGRTPGRVFQTPPLVEESGHARRSRGSKHRHGKDAGADEAHGEEQARVGARDGLQCLGGLSGAADLLVMSAEGCRAGHHDREHDQHGEDHPGEHVQPAGSQTPLRLPGRPVFQSRRIAALEVFCTELLHTLRGLPEEHVRADRRAQHRDDQGPVGGAPFQPSTDEALEDLIPVHVADEQDAHVDEQDQTQPLEDPTDPLERPGDHCHPDSDAGDRRPERGGAGMQQLHALTDRHQVSGKVQRVRDDQRGDQDSDHDARAVREATTDQFAEAVSGGQGHSVADLLSGHHQREAHRHGPQRAGAIGRSGLRIGRDARGVVICGPGHQARAQRPEEGDDRIPALSRFRRSLRSSRARGILHRLLAHTPLHSSSVGRGAPRCTSGWMHPLSGCFTARTLL